MVTCAPIACRHMVSGSLSLPSRGSFHLSFTVLSAIGHWVVFSLGRWSSRFQTGFHVSRPTPDPAAAFSVSVTGLSPSLAGFPKTVLLPSGSLMQSITPPRTRAGLGSFPFARRYSGNRCFFLFLRVLRCFSSPGSLPYVMDWRMDDDKSPGFPIQKSADRWICAPPRSLSQLVTSFFGS